MSGSSFKIWIMILFITALSSSRLSAENFPVPDAIQPNVSFWVKVYSEYTTTQAIVHDSKDLNIIYDVIELKPYDARRARKINRLRMKNTRAKYQRILKRLAANPKTRNPEARRIAKLFGPKASAKTYRSASRRVRCQIGQRDRFREGLIRSGIYIDEIRIIFKANGLPEQLAYLPHVESSFNYKAYSKFGAAGIWQFTRSTGKRFMTVGYDLDERRDPIISTHAAAALLKENYKKLDSWPLAITAYNHGATGMAKAKRKHGRYETIFKKYRSRTFKFASRNFYSEFLAASHVAANYKIYFGELTLDQPLKTHAVVLKNYVGFKDLCKHYKVPAETAMALNPALRQPVFKGQKYVPKGYTFHLPSNTALASSRLPPIPEKLYKKQQKHSHFYTVQRGDTAGRIARKHGVKLSDLIVANNLSRRATIYPRQTLRIPLPSTRVKKRKRTYRVKTAPVLAKKKDSPEIAEVFNNHLDKNKHYLKPILASIIPTALPFPKKSKELKKAEEKKSEAPSQEIVSADVRFVQLNLEHSPPMGKIQVEVEETLGHFAEWADVRTQRIRRFNGLPFGRKLHLHQKVNIPLDRVSAQQFEEQRYEYHKRLQEDFFAVYQIGEMTPYRVKRGDNLWNLCLDKFDIPMWLLKNSNPRINFAALRARQELMIPTIEKSASTMTSLEPESEPEQEPEKESSDISEPQLP